MATAKEELEKLRKSAVESPFAAPGIGASSLLGTLNQRAGMKLEAQQLADVDRILGLERTVAGAAPASAITLPSPARLQETAAGQRAYAEAVQAGTIPPLASQGGPAFPTLVRPAFTTEAYPGQAATEARLAAFDQTPVVTPAQATSAINADLTNALLRTALGQPATQGAGIDFGAGDLARAPAAAPANPFAAQFSNLLGQVTALANTQPSGSDSFVDFFQKAAARKRGQEGLVKLAELAGQATTAQAGQQLQAQTEQARLQQAGQEAQQRNALLAGQSLLQAQTSLAERQAVTEAARAKAAAEAPKTQAETAKTQLEAQNLQLAQNARLAFAQNPTPENAAILQSIITGQAAQPQKPTVTKFLGETGGEQVLITSPQGRVLQAGTPGQLLEQQNIGTVAKGTAVPSSVDPTKVYFADPQTGRTIVGTPEQFYAAYPSAKK